MIAPETYHIVNAMRRSSGGGVIARWKESVANWAQMHRTDPNAAAVNAWLPHWQPRPFYTSVELAPMWPALAIATGFTNQWPAVLKSPARLESELDFHGEPRLQSADWLFTFLNPRTYFIVENFPYWMNRSITQEEFENALR